MPTQVRGVPGGTCVRLHSCRAPPPAEVLVDEGLRGCGRLNVRVAPCSKGPALALPAIGRRGGMGGQRVMQDV
eukprot:1149763-Pelagomonas_calceolata.AAC.10